MKNELKSNEYELTVENQLKLHLAAAERNELDTCYSLHICVRTTNR